MPIEPSRPLAPGTVLAHVPHPGSHASTHERSTLLQYAQRIARLMGCACGGFHDPAARRPGPLYFVPADTLATQDAGELGIHGIYDLFGGVVPHAFVATKAISHPLVSPDAAAVDGWNPDLAERLGDSVLAGFSAFSAVDARQAGARLLANGPVRVKPVKATGGRGQSVAQNPAQLDELLETLDETEVRAHGLVLEEDLAELVTFSVGQVQVKDQVASYYGFQKLTPDNQGQPVFGGSELTVARGGFDSLLALRPDPDVTRAIEQARRYDAAVRASYPGFYASRSNYDILVGRDASGRRRSGVLEQSWRVGGATGPELAALESFQADPSRRWVRTCGVEIFGDSPNPPPHATVYFRGVDPEAGPLTKYTVVQDDADPR